VPEFLVLILGFFKAGYSERTTDTVAQILGRAPGTFEQYARDYRAAWGGLSERRGLEADVGAPAWRRWQAPRDAPRCAQPGTTRRAPRRRSDPIPRCEAAASSAASGRSVGPPPIGRRVATAIRWIALRSGIAVVQLAEADSLPPRSACSGWIRIRSVLAFLSIAQAAIRL